MSIDVVQGIGQMGITGLAILMFWMWWHERKDQARRESKDREVLVNHLSKLVAADTEGKVELAKAMTLLTSAINTFHRECERVQVSMTLNEERCHITADKLCDQTDRIQGIIKGEKNG